MSAELVAGLVAIVVALIGGGVGWAQVRKHGRVLTERDQAREERDAAKQDLDAGARPPLDGPESVDVLRRVRDAD